MDSSKPLSRSTATPIRAVWRPSRGFVVDLRDLATGLGQLPKQVEPAGAAFDRGYPDVGKRVLACRRTNRDRYIEFRCNAELLAGTRQLYWLWRTRQVAKSVMVVYSSTTVSTSAQETFRSVPSERIRTKASSPVFMPLASSRPRRRAWRKPKNFQAFQRLALHRAMNLKTAAHR